jgi:hypothetical protein
MPHFLSGDHFVGEASSSTRWSAVAWGPLLTSMFLYAGMLGVTCALAMRLELYVSLGPWEDKIFRGLLSSSRFRAEYVGATIAAPAGALVFYARRSYMKAHALSNARQLEWPTDASQRPGCFRRIAP